MNGISTKMKSSQDSLFLLYYVGTGYNGHDGCNPHRSDDSK